MSKSISSLPVANISDALRKLGYSFQSPDSQIRPVFTPVALYGPAYPVQCYAGATWAVENAIEEAPAGSVLVIDGGGFPGAVLMGGLLSLRAKMRGVAGAILDGAVRDIQELKREAWPIFARSITPWGGTHDQQGSWGKPISFGGVAVNPGDYVCADDDGIAIIPSSILTEVTRVAEQIQEREAIIETHLRKGASLQEAISQIEAKKSNQSRVD